MQPARRGCLGTASGRRPADERHVRGPGIHLLELHMSEPADLARAVPGLAQPQPQGPSVPYEDPQRRAGVHQRPVEQSPSTPNPRRTSRGRPRQRRVPLVPVRDATSRGQDDASTSAPGQRQTHSRSSAATCTDTPGAVSFRCPATAGMVPSRSSSACVPSLRAATTSRQHARTVTRRSAADAQVDGLAGTAGCGRRTAPRRAPGLRVSGDPGGSTAARRGRAVLRTPAAAGLLLVARAMMARLRAVRDLPLVLAWRGRTAGTGT